LGPVKVASKLLGVVVGERLKANNIERLKHMSTVRRKHSKQYTVSLAVVNTVCREVTAIAVEYEEAPVTPAPRFLLCAAVKSLL
jgi:hypothetical protein